MVRSLSLSGFGQLGKEPCPTETPTSWTSRLEYRSWWGPSTGGRTGSKGPSLQQSCFETFAQYSSFLCAFSFLYIQTWVKEIKFLGSAVFCHVFSLFGHPLSFKSISLPKCLQPFLLHYFQECSETHFRIHSATLI